MGRINKFIFGALGILAIMMGLVLYWHNAVFLIDGPDNGFLLTKTETIRYSVYLPAFYLHITSGGIVLMLGILQFSQKIRGRLPLWHRLSGQIYTFIILLLTAPSGLTMSFFANGGIFAQTGFGLLSILWWLFTLKGFQYGLKKDWPRHQAYMLRSYALTFAAVTLRLYSFFFALAGMRGSEVYPIIVWMSWVPSLLIVEIWIRLYLTKSIREMK